MRTLKILSVLSIAGILLLSFFSWYSCDDFCNRIELARYPVFKMAFFQYMNWDGRSLSVTTFVQLFALKYLPAELTTFLWAISFVGSVVLIFKIVQLENPRFFEGASSIIGIAILCAVMWLGMWKLIPDIIYWPTGGSYSLLNLSGLLWLYFFLRWLKAGHFSKGHCIFILFFAFVCGVNSHNFVSALIVLCLVELAQQWFVKKDARAAFYVACSLVGLLAGACIVFFAPGNQVRLQAISYTGLSSKFLFFYFLVLAKYIYWLLCLFLLCFFVAWLSGKEFFSGERRNFSLQMKTWISGLRKIHSAFAIVYRHKYLLAAMSTILVFTATSFFAVPRTSIFFATFIVIWFFQHAWNKESKIHSARFMYGSILFLSVFICVILFQMVSAWPVKRQLKERERLFVKSMGTDVIVPAIPASTIPFAFSFTDVSPDSDYWVNRCVAGHYELKSVRSISK